MLYKMELIIHMFVSVFSMFPLIYYLLKSKFNIEKSKIIILYIYIAVMRVVLFYNLYIDSSFKAEDSLYIKLLFNLAFVALLYFLVRKLFYKILLIFLILIQCYTFIFGNTYIILNLLQLKYPDLSHIHLVGSFLMLIQFRIMFPIVLDLINNKVMFILSIEDNKILKDHCIIQIILIFFEFIISIGIDMSFSSNIKYIITRCFVLCIYYYLFSTLFKTYNEIISKAKLEKESLYISNQLNLQREQYKSIDKHIKEVMRAKHDLRHHITLIEAYLANKDTKKLEEYIDEYKLTIPNDVIICGNQNFTLNTLLQHYTKIANSHNINISIKFDLNNNISIQDTDLCIVFGNCIENAIEACKKLNISERKIFIRAKLHNDLVIITIDNNFNGEVNKYGDVYLSSKRGYHSEGIGITSVKEVVKKYNGLVKFELTETEFKVSIMMKQCSNL